MDSKSSTHILALRLPHLLAQAEARLNPALRGRAFILAAGDGPRSPVLGISPELAGACAGLRVGEALSRWRNRLPHLLVVVSRPERARPLLDEARAGLDALAPHARELPGAVFQLELRESGLLRPAGREQACEQACGLACSQARDLLDRLRRNGLVVAAGLGDSPLAARLMARRAGPGELHTASHDDGARALDSLPLAGLPGLPQGLPAALARTGIRFVGEARELARELGREEWRRRFGSAGLVLASLLADLDDPAPAREDLRRLTVRRRLDTDTADPLLLDSALLDLLEDLHTRAREEGLGPARLRLRLLWNDGRLTERERQVAPDARESRRQTLRREGRALLAAQLETRRLRVRELEGSLGLEAAPAQLALFAARDPEPREGRLDEALGQLRRRWGAQVVTVGPGLPSITSSQPLGGSTS
jgi:hypothetical protein